ncbi:D-alanyl-D-alanine carboxypeptidase family protein [Neogemmobacter tilapiae]|nr:D-alanyl-D-alanine carboxypeptidase family protein [Gemmobacter tilapiae]
MGVLAACAARPEPAGAAPFAAFVIDAKSGEVLYEDNATARLHPASLTKMLTLYIAFDALERGEISLDTMVTVTPHAASQPPSRLGLKSGQKIAMRYLLRAAAIKSANDAATAIGEAISGSEEKFAARMNRTAKALGMTGSTFKNANGLTAKGHLSTARDMTILGRHLFYDFPQYYNLFSRRSTDAGLAEVANTNRRFLDAYKGADGIKTGFTNAAGFNLTASAERDGVRLIGTVFGGTSTANRNAKMAELLDLGFKRANPRAAEQPPAAPNYEPVPDEALVAEVEAMGENVSAPAKTLRVAIAPATSQRPKGRPGKVTEPLPFAVADASGAIEADPQATAAAVDAMQDGIAGALAEAGVGEATAPVTEVAALPVETVAEVEVAAAPEVVEAVPAETVVAAAEPVVAEPVMAEPVAAEALPFALVDPNTLEEVAPVVVAEAPAQPQPAQIIHTVTPAEPEVTGDVVLMAANTMEPQAQETEVVTRISTSGGRHWGVNIGRFDSQSTAERALMKTMLSESSTLSESLRKIVSKSGGYDANFMGLTQDQADLACRRLQARGTQCFTIGP